MTCRRGDERRIDGVVAQPILASERKRRKIEFSGEKSDARMQSTTKQRIDGCRTSANVDAVVREAELSRRAVERRCADEILDHVKIVEAQCDARHEVRRIEAHGETKIMTQQRIGERNQRVAIGKVVLSRQRATL